MRVLLLFVVVLAACSEPDETGPCALHTVDWEAGDHAHLEMLNFYGDRQGEHNEFVRGRREGQTPFFWRLEADDELFVRLLDGTDRRLDYELTHEGSSCRLRLSDPPVPDANYNDFSGPAKRR